jgi:MazG family protein
MPFEKIAKVVAQLRDPKTGCPWDLKQTHSSLLPYLIEESYEFIQSVEEGDTRAMKEELGDVLLQVVLHAQLASEKEQFNLEDVCQSIAEKMIRRHPHVFKDKTGVNTPMEQIKNNWSQIKSEEKAKKQETVQSQLPHKLNFGPALAAAYNIGKKTNTLDFDFKNHQEAFDKVSEEWEELKQVYLNNLDNRQHLQEEIGDLLFSLAQLARHLDMNPELLLNQGNRKFIHRYQRMEKISLKTKNKRFSELSREEKEDVWQEVKRAEKNV